jgi:N,N-dimethylformamidase
VTTVVGEILGYADRWSVRAGGSIDFHVSTGAERYRAELVRLTRGGPRPFDQPDALDYDLVPSSAAGEYVGRSYQPRPGSYGWCRLRGGLRAGGALTLCAWIWPTTPHLGRIQGMVGYLGAGDDRRSIGLVLDEEGAVAVRYRGADGHAWTVSTGEPCQRARWYRATATVDLATGQVSIEQMPLRAWGVEGARAEANAAQGRPVELPDDGTLVIAAGTLETDADRGRRYPVECFNGKLDRPAIRGRDAVIADWDLSQGIGTQTAIDASGREHHAELVNGPTRAMTGHNWTGAEVDFRRVPEQYGAVHFHDDDLADAGWPVGVSLPIPEDLRSGVYALKLTCPAGEDMVPFFVRPARGATARVAFLAPTMSYMAYSNQATRVLNAELFTGEPRVRDAWDDYIDDHPEIGQSMYNDHSDGSGIARVTLLRPMLNIRPWSRFWLSSGGGWAFSGDMFLIDWLEHSGREYDVFTDHDLHEEGKELIEQYDVVISGMHPEYVSGNELDAIEAYMNGGGHFMYLGGNGFYWVTTRDPSDPSVIELRRAKAGTRTWEGHPGEDHHSTTGELGGLWRHRGRAPQAIFGVGFAAQGGGGSAPYQRTSESENPRAAFIFEGVARDEVIGDFGNNMGGAAGDEIDRADYDLGTPAHALLLATSSGLHTDLYQRTIEELPLIMPGHGGTEDPDVRADIVYFETPNGGGMFSVGSIDWTASLSHNDYDNNVARITANVLDAFLMEAARQRERVT